MTQVLDPARLTDILHQFADASDDDHTYDLEREAARRSLAECDQHLARYRAALEAGTDPTLIARWTAEAPPNAPSLSTGYARPAAPPG